MIDECVCANYELKLIEGTERRRCQSHLMGRREARGLSEGDSSLSALGSTEHRDREQHTILEQL